MTGRRTARGPFFEELTLGQQFHAPAVTLTQGLAAGHHAIVGNRLFLALDHDLGARVTGGPLAPPALVWDLAIGQSTGATQNVRANLFYRGLSFARAPQLGDTLSTTTTVVGLRQTTSRPAGLAALHVQTVDQHQRPVLGFWRCAMIGLGDPSAVTGAADDLDLIGTEVTDEALTSSVSGWDLTPLPAGPRLQAGDGWEVDGGDVVSSAPELARLTMNVAAVHHDARAGGGSRLVYGGHTIGLALLQASRALPDILTVVGWHSCDHLGPVHEGDTIRSTVEVERVTTAGSGPRLAHLRVHATADPADRDAPGDPRPVLDWRPVMALAAP